MQKRSKSLPEILFSQEGNVCAYTHPENILPLETAIICMEAKGKTNKTTTKKTPTDFRGGSLIHILVALCSDLHYEISIFIEFQWPSFALRSL